MEYLRNLYKQRDFSNEELSNEIHSLQVEIIQSSNSNLHHEKKNKILSELYQITSIPASQTKMTPSRWDDLRFNIYLFIASTIPNCNQIPNLNLATNSGPLFYIMCFLNPSHMSFIYKQSGIKNDESSRATPVPLIMPQNFYTKEQLISVLIEIFDNFTQLIIKAQTSSFQFYTRSQLSYGHLILIIILQERAEFIKDPRFFTPFNFIKNTLYPRNAKVSNENDRIILTNDMHYFLIDLIRLLGTEKVTNFIDEAFDTMLCCFKDIPISSITIANYYHILFKLKLSGDEKSSNIEIFYQNSLLRVNDIFKTFKSGNILAYFNTFYKNYHEHRAQKSKILYLQGIIYNIMHFIKQIVYIQNPQDIMNSRRKGVNTKPEPEFLNNLYNFYTQLNFRWPYLFFIEKIISVLTYYTRKMCIVKAIKIRDATNKNICIEETISFYDQLLENDTYLLSKEKQMAISNNSQSNINSYQTSNTQESGNKNNHLKYTRNSYMNKVNSSIDHLLFSAFECRTYTSFEEAISAYEKLVKVFDVNKKIYVPLNQFGIPILQKLFSLEPSVNRSTINFYLERFLRSLFNFIILSSYRLMLLNTFTKFQQLYKNQIKNQSLTKPPEYVFNYAKNLSEVFRPIFNQQNLLLIATTLADCLFTATKKQILTYQCIRYIITILRGPTSSLGNLLFQKMIEILYSNCLLESSYDNSEIILFQQWLFLIIKIFGRKGSVYPPNTMFASTLRNYQHTFVSYFFHKPNAMNQAEMVLTIKKYIDSMKFNASEIGLKQFENPDSKALLNFQKYYIFLNSFRQEYQSEVQTLYLDRAIFNYSDSYIPPQLLDVVFSTGNIAVIRKLYNLTLKQLEKVSHFPDYETDNNLFLFSRILQPIHFLPKDLAIQFIEMIPKMPTIFLPYLPITNIAKKGYLINIDPRIDNFYRPLNDEETELNESESRACIEYSQIISSISQNSSRTKNEAKHILMLLSILIDSKQVLRFNLSDLENTFDILFTISRFTDLRVHVESLIDKMNKLFAPIIIDSKSFDYVFAFAFSFTISQSESSKYAINQFKSFIYGINMKNYNGIVIADQLFSVLKFPYNIFNSLLLFTLLATKRPGCIKFSHFLSLLSLIKDSGYFMHLSKEIQIFCKLFKRFLEKFIVSLNNEQKGVFMTYCYSIVVSRTFNNTTVKLIIIKKMPMLNIPYDRYDPNIYKCINDELFYNEMSMIIGCGSRIPLSQEMVDRAIDRLANSDPKQSASIQCRLTFILMLTKAKINIELFLKDDMPKQAFSKIYNFLVRFSTLQSSKKFDKCIAWVYAHNPDLIRNLLQRSISNNIEQVGAIIKDEKKTKYLQHFLSISSKYIEPNHVAIVLIAINELTKEIKMNHINSIVSFIKILASFDFTRPDLQRVVLGPCQQNQQMSFLAQFLNDICKLQSFNGLPVEDFMKTKVTNFLLNFKIETIRFIFVNSNEFESRCFFDILYNMIISDKTNEMLNTFIQSINPTDQFHSQIQPFTDHNPYIYEIETKLSENPEYVTEQNFINLVKSQFSVFFNEKPSTITSDNDSIQLNSTINAYINIMRIIPDFISLVSLSSFFAFGNNVYTSLYLKYKTEVFGNSDKQFYVEMLQFLLNECAPNYDEESNQIIDNSASLLQIDLVENKNIHRFITNSATAILLSNLIKGISRFQVDDDIILFNHLLATLRCMVKNQSQIYCAIKCYYTLFKNNKKLSLNLIPELTNIFLAFPTLLEQPEPYPIILTLKFAIKLLNHDLLHEKILSNIIQHIFTFQKFIDNPYISTVTMLFNKANSYYANAKHNQIPEAVATSFKVFLIEKIVLFKDFEKLIIVTKSFPLIIKTIPFSTLASLIHNIEYRENNQIFQLFQNLDSILKLYPMVDEVPDSIQNIFSKISFNFLYKFLDYIDKEQGVQMRLEQQTQAFLGFAAMLMKHSKMMPEKIIILASSKIHHKSAAVSRFCQIICILATEFADENIINNQSKAIMESFDFIIKDGVIKMNYQIIRTYIQSIFSRQKLSRSFAKHFLHAVDTFPLNDREMNMITKFETSHQLLNFYVKDTKDNDKLDHLLTFLTSVDESTIKIMRLWIYNYLDFICDLQYEHQNIIFDFIMEKLQKNSMEFPFNINLLRSKSVSNQLKQKYLYQLQDTLPTLHHDEIYGLLKLLNEFPFNCFNYKILCHLYLIMKSTDEGKLIHLDELAKILGKTEEERFLSLFTYLHPTKWNNTSFIYIVFICMKHTKIIKPLVMLADCFEKISSKFAIPLFLRIMNDKTVSSFHKLLISVLSIDKNDIYSELISSITNAYSIKSSEFIYNPSTFRNELKFTKILPKLLYKTIKVSNDTHLYYDNLSLKVADLIPDKLLLPNKMNDEIFSLLPPNSSIESLAASAQFFLSNYEESSKVFYDCYDAIFSSDSSILSSPQIYFDERSSYFNLSVSSLNKASILLKRMMDISDDFVSKKGTFRIFERYNHDDPYLIPSLENALNSLNISAPDNAMNEISIATMRNINYFRHHKYPSIYEIQRIISVQMVLSMMNQRIPSNPKKLEVLTNGPKAPQIAGSNINIPQNPNMMKKMPNQPQLSSNTLKIPSIFIKSIFHPIYESFISNFEDYLYSIERIAAKSKENQLGKSTLNLNVILDASSNIRSFDLNDSTTAIFSHEYRNLFDSVIDTNSFGFFTVTMSQVNTAIETLVRLINSDKFKQQGSGVNVNVGNVYNPNQATLTYKRESAEEKWPGFCFSLLTMLSTLSPALHQKALQGYYNLIQKQADSFFLHESYIARMLTLINLSIAYLDDNLINNSMKFSELLFKDKMMAHYTKLWGSQVAFIYSHPRFQPQIVDSLKPYSSLQHTMHSHKLVKKPFPDQLDVISKLHHIFSLLFDINTSVFDYNEEDDETEEGYNLIDINKCSQKCITYRSIESELDIEVKTDINRYTEYINQKLPVEFEFQLPKKLHGSRIKIHHINRDFTKISDNIIAFTAITTCVSHQVFFVEKVQSTDNMISFAGVFYLFNQILKYSYPSRMRGIHLSLSLPIEIGEGMIMYTFPSDSIPISRFRFCNHHNKEVEETISSVKHIVPFFLKQYVINSTVYDVKEFIEMRKSLIANFAAYSAIRSIFSLPQPKEEEIFVSLKTAEFPLILSHFSIPKDYSRTATLIPKILVDFFSTTSNPPQEENDQDQEKQPEQEEEEVNEAENQRIDQEQSNNNNNDNNNDDDDVVVTSMLGESHDNFDESDLLFELHSDGVESHSEFATPTNENFEFANNSNSNYNNDANADVGVVNDENNNNDYADVGDDDDGGGEDDAALEGIDSETRFDRYFELAFASVHSSFASYIEVFRSFVEMPIQDTTNKQIDSILASRDVIEASLFDYAPPFSDGSSGSDSVEWFSRINDYIQNSKGPFERAPVEPPRAITIPPPSTTVVSAPVRDSFTISTPTSSTSNFGSATGLGLSDDFGAFDIGGLTNFGGIGVGVNINSSSSGIGNSNNSSGGIGVGIGVSDSGISLNLGGGGGQSGNISAMNSMNNMNSLNSFASRSPINQNPSFDMSQEISRNNSLMGFNRTPQEVQQNQQPSIGLFGSNSFDFGTGGFDQSQAQQMLNMQMMQQQQQQQQGQPQPQPFLNSRMSSFDSGFGFNNPQPVPKVVSPQIQITPPRPPPQLPQQQQQQQQQQMNQQHQIQHPSNDFIGFFDQDDDPYANFF